MITVGLDVETSCKPLMHPWQDGAYLVSVGLAWETGIVKTWIFNHNETAFRKIMSQQEMIQEIVEALSTAGRVVGHNLKFDINWMRKIGVSLDHCKLYCTQVVEFLLRGQKMGRLKLADLSEQYLKVAKQDRVKTFWDAGIETADIPLRILTPYLEQDCINTLAIFQKQTPIVIEKGMSKLVQVQCESTRILSEIECNGMLFNVEVAQRAADKMHGQLTEIDAGLLQAFEYDYKIGSGDELSVALFGGILKTDGREYYPRKLKKYLTAKDMCPLEYKSKKCIIETEMPGLGFKPVKGSALKKEGYYSTDKDNIAQLRATNKKQKVVKKLLTERSAIAQAYSTLVGSSPTSGLINKVQSDGCLHGQYNQTVAKTGRLSSKDPNSQNFPREGTSPIKESIQARFDGIAAADLSQIEWRAAAFQSQDAVMLAEIYAGVDPHRENAIQVFGADPADEGTKKFKEIRTVAKIVTFRLLYGGTPFGFWIDQKMPNYSKLEWVQIVEKFYMKYTGLKEWQDANIATVYKNGGWLQIVTGRMLYFDKGAKGYDMRQIKNYPVQGMATADIMPLAMCVIYKKYRDLKLKSLIIGQVHDALIFDYITEELPIIAKLCSQVMSDLPKYIEQMWGFEFNVPLGGDVEIGVNYGHMDAYVIN